MIREKAFIKFSTHKKYHTGDKPFKFYQCDKVFSRSDSLTQHKRSHTGEKPFKCDPCDEALSKSGNLTQHKTRSSLKGGDEGAKAPLCPNHRRLSGTN